MRSVGDGVYGTVVPRGDKGESAVAGVTLPFRRPLSRSRAIRSGSWRETNMTRGGAPSSPNPPERVGGRGLSPGASRPKVVIVGVGLQHSPLYRGRRNRLATATFVSFLSIDHHGPASPEDHRRAPRTHPWPRTTFLQAGIQCGVPRVGIWQWSTTFQAHDGRMSRRWPRDAPKLQPPSVQGPSQGLFVPCHGERLGERSPCKDRVQEEVSQGGNPLQ